MKTIKNIALSSFTIIAAIALLVTVCTMPANAEEYFNPPMDTYTSQSTQLEYNVPSSFVVEIPAYMSIDTPVQLTGDSFNIAPDKEVVASIDFDCFNNADNIPLYMDGEDDGIEVAIYDKASGGSKVTKSSNIVARFEADDTGYAVSNYFHAEMQETMWAKAGQYHGTLTFTISTQYKN